MKTTWSLDELYKGFDDPEFKKDWDALPKEIETMNAFARKEFDGYENATEIIEQYLSMQLQLAEFSKLSSFLSLTLSTDSTNSEATKLTDRLSGEYANLAGANTRFKEYIGGLENIDSVIESSAFLEEHGFFLRELARESKHTASELEEQLLSKLITTGSDAWNNQFNMLTSTVMIDVEIEGQASQMTLAALRNLAYHGNQSTRKAAYEAELLGYQKMDTAVANSLNAVKGEAITVAKLRGYDCVLHMTLAKSRMDKETLDAMWAAITESLPEIRAYFHRKAQLLGHKNGLPFYDLFAPVGTAELSLSYEQAMDIVTENFTSFSPELGDFARHAFENQWIDVYPREGKIGGAFCHTIKPLGESRIMTNFSDSFDGTLTLGHELGHAYHGKCLREETALNASYPMPIAETASTFCETLIVRSALQTATPEEGISILESYLSGISQTVVDIYSRYLFEENLIKQRENGPLSVEELCGLMTDAQKKAYGDGLDPDFLHPYMWLCKPHYYRAGLNFYNFPYAYGQLFALGLYAMYQTEGDDFIPKYDAILNATGRMNLYEVGKLANINVRDKAFWKSSLATAISDIGLFLELTK